MSTLFNSSVSLFFFFANLHRLTVTPIRARFFVLVTLTSPNSCSLQAIGSARVPATSAVGEVQVFDSMISDPACHGEEEAQIREELVRSAWLIPRLFALHNILKVSRYTSGRA